MKKAFTMVELVFVIVVIGILSAVAVPKLAPIVSDAKNAKGKATLSSVRSALATQRQKLVLQGQFGGITKLRDGNTGVFTKFMYKDNNDANKTGVQILDYDVPNCTNSGCWSTTDGVTYIYHKGSSNCTFKLENNRFVDKTTGTCSFN